MDVPQERTADVLCLGGHCANWTLCGYSMLPYVAKDILLNFCCMKSMSARVLAGK
jgi:hypothetical protein